jgi:tryptophanyl-tRNA synthetase
MSTKKRALTGIQPSGQVHIGNYLGAIKPALELQNQYQCIYFVADLHALTSLKDGATLSNYTLELTATWLALGLDINNHIFFRQSDVPCVAEYAWYLSCFTGMGLLEKCHAYKDKVSQGKDASHGLFAYPVLMAADILMYDVDLVPVGKDQKQHVEVARDIAGSVNATYNKQIIKLPTPVLQENTMYIPGLDGQKMSKSYNNTIPLFATEKALEKLVMSIKTDSTGIEEPKALDGSLVGQLFGLFSSQTQYQDLKQRMLKGGMGWGHAKKELFGVINDHIKTPRIEFEKLKADPAYLLKVLATGTEKAKQIATLELQKLRDCFGFEDINKR